ncbi:MAG: endonuclease III [Spirochaetes bacterium]|nr:endonuclease III [Spirochaetota bacterium]
MDRSEIAVVIKLLREKIGDYENPIVTAMSLIGSTPFAILIATILSARTKDSTTGEACSRILKTADTPEKMIELSRDKIEKLIYPVGFYRVKSSNVLKTSQMILDKFQGKVPDTIDELVTLPGVGRKTANLVLTHGFKKPAICVDIHVHRISNRLGYIETSTPYETEMLLREILPKEHWMIYNDLLVAYGQNICTPISPWCSKCPVADMCDRVGVKSSR